MAIGKILEKAGAKDIRFSKIQGPAEHQSGDKTRYNFTVDDQDAAVALFQEVSSTKNLVLDGRISLKIFYVKPGKFFRSLLKRHTFTVESLFVPNS
jgi:hypothetical protein